MNCEDVRVRLVDYQRGRLPAAAHADVRAHLEGCADCTQAEAVEQELTGILERRLPQHPASLALKRRLAAQWSPSPPASPWWGRWRPAFAPAVAVAIVLVVGAPLLLVYARRLHPISLLIFRAEGLAWPTRGLTPVGGVDAYVSAERGFNVVMWRRGGLGYALVSDVEAGELKSLAVKLIGRS